MASLHEDGLEREELFRTLDEQPGAVFWVAAPDFSRLLHVSKAYEKTWSYPVEDVYADTWAYLRHIHEEDRPAVEATIAGFVRGDETSDLYFRFTRGDGAERWVWTKAFSSKDDAGRVRRIVGISYDVTERKLVELELARAKEAAEESNRAKSAFLTTMSHESRSPMHAILGAASLLRASALDPAQRELVETLQESGLAMMRILNDALDFSALEAGQVDLVHEAFDPAAATAAAVDAYRQMTEEKGLALELRKDPDLPRAVLGDARRVKQVLGYLVSNAVKFTETGGVVVSVSPASEGSRLTFEVRDTGIGIEKGAGNQIFQPFRQLDTSRTRRFGGSGLGLALSKRFVDLMGGSIDYESEGIPGRGTRLRFEIPVAEVLDSPEASLPPSPVGPPPDRDRPPRVLVVEDGKVNARIALLMLRKLGYDADAASNGVEALEALRRNRYQLVLMDVEMPVMDGLEATRRIRAEFDPEVQPRIIAMTAGALRENREACLAAGMDGFLPKPVQLAQLATELGQAVGAGSAPVPRAST